MDNTIDYLYENLHFRGQTGGEFKYDCPSCGAGGKFWYNARKNLYVCYRCGIAGHIVSFVAEHEGISYRAARKLLGGDEDYDVSPHEFQELFAQFKQYTISNPEILTQQHIHIEGACWHAYQPTCEFDAAVARESSAAVQARGFSRDFLLGMSTGYAWHGRWANRTILPLFQSGVLVYFQAWDHGKRSEKAWKYLNPKNTEVPYGKSKLVYNYDRWTNADVLVVAEGVFNAWAIEQAGYPAVAVFGKSLSPHQLLKIIEHRAQRVIIGFDPDARADTLEAVSLLRSYGKDALLVDVPVGYDWNDLPVEHRQDLLRTARQADWLWG